MNRSYSLITLLSLSSGLLLAGVREREDSSGVNPQKVPELTSITVNILPGDSANVSPPPSLEFCVPMKISEDGPPNPSSAVLVRTSQILQLQDGWIETSIIPDTAVIGRLPLATFLSSGTYLLGLKKEGYRAEQRKLQLGGKGLVRVAIPLYSLEYLRHKHDQWTSGAWISAGMTALAVLSTLYFNEQVNVNMNHYYDAMTIADAVKYRNRVDNNRVGYRISSGAVIVSASVAIICWLVAESFR